MEQFQVVDCGGTFDISQVAQWQEKILAILDVGVPIILKADEIQRVDAAGLQALLGLFVDAEKKSISVRWENPSYALKQAAKLLGLSEHLQLENQLASELTQ